MINVPLVVSLAAYVQYDSVGNDGTDLALVSERVNQLKGGGYISWGRLTDGALQSEAYKLYCYYAIPSAIADADTFVPLEADHLVLFSVLDIPAANYHAKGAEAYVAFFSGKDVKTNEYHIFPTLGAGVLYFYLEAQATPDYAAVGDLTLDLCVMVM